MFGKSLFWPFVCQPFWTLASRPQAWLQERREEQSNPDGLSYPEDEELDNKVRESVFSKLWKYGMFLVFADQL